MINIMFYILAAVTRVNCHLLYQPLMHVAIIFSSLLLRSLITWFITLDNGLVTVKLNLQICNFMNTIT